jgi:pimeloyl-ACP methyl ester carboxylesterase
MKHVSIGAVDIAYIRQGSGAPLLLLHGGETDHRNFDGFTELLSPSFDTIAYDQRDCGQSTYSRENDYALKDLAKDAAELILSLGFDRAHVLGSSAGGLVAQQLALHFPERVDRLVLNVTTPVNESIHENNPGIVERFARLTADKDYRGIAEVFSTPAYVKKHPELIETIRALRSGATVPSRTHDRRIRAITTCDPNADVSHIVHKTLVIAGECDQLARVDIAKRLSSKIPNATLKVIPNSGHTALLEHKELYSTIVREFLQG